MVVFKNYHFLGDIMENKAIRVLIGLNALRNAIIWEINDGEPLNNGINSQLFFLINSNQFGGE